MNEDADFIVADMIRVNGNNYCYYYYLGELEYAVLFLEIIVGINSLFPAGIPPHIDTHSAFEDAIISLSLGSQVRICKY